MIPDDRSNPAIAVALAMTLTALLGPSVVHAQQQDIIEVSPSAIEFGDVIIGSSASRTVDIENMSDVLIYVTSIGVSNTDTDFSVDNDGGFYLRSGESARVGVSFSPGTSGAHKATLEMDASIVTIGKDEFGRDEVQDGTGTADVAEIETIALTGTGVSATRIAVSPTEVDFGGVRIGETATRDIIISNTGGVSLTIYDIFLEEPGDFRITAADSIVVAPGEEESIQASFHPGDAGNRTSAVIIESSDNQQPVIRVSLAGVGVTVGDINLSTGQLEFGDVLVGESRTLPLTVANGGQGDLTVESIAVEGSDAFDPELSDAFTLAPNEERSFDVVFTPDQAGSYEAELVIASDDPMQPSVDVSLLGRGIRPRMVTSPDSLDFGGRLVGLQDTLVVQVFNEGTADLRLSDLDIVGAHPEDFRVSSVLPLTIPSQGEEVIDVIFRPTSEGVREAVLQISSGTAGLEASVVLAGRGARVEPITDTAVEESEAQLSIEVPDGVSLPQQGRIFFRKTGEPSYQSRALTTEGNRFTARLPADHVTARGVQYYLEFTDGLQTITYPAEDPRDNALSWPVRVPEMTPSVEMEPLSYRMVSIPLTLDVPSLRQAINDDYEPYDSENWRLFRWQDGGYVEFPELEDTLEPGMAFWLITRDGRSFDVDSAQSVDPSGPFAIELQPGYNQIGNPFAFPVSWEDVQYEGDVNPPVVFDGVEMRYDRQLLQPWEGYFVYNEEDIPVTLQIPPIRAGGSNDENSDQPLGEVIAGNEGYVVQLATRIPETSWKDTQNWLGVVDSQRSDSIDAVRAEAPAVNSNLRMSILHDGGRYAAMVKERSRSGSRWEVELSREDLAGRLDDAENVEIQLEEYGVERKGFQISIFDHEYKQLNIVETGVLSVSFPPRSATRRFTVMMGTPSFINAQRDSLLAVPDEYVLEQNYPNPFNPHTTISYRLPRGGRVVLDVFDALGRRVRRLVDEEQPPGRYEINWNGEDASGRPLSSGVYLYRLRAGRFTATNKALLIR